MSRNYDNWERLVGAVIKREEDWQLCHQLSIRTSSICSEASSISDFSSSFRSSHDDKYEESGDQKPFGDSVLIQLQRGVRISDKNFLAEETQLAVKKLLGKAEEATQGKFMIVLPKLRHKNVAAGRVLNDYNGRGSVHHLLHADEYMYRPNWESRLKIAIGAARGIAHIHLQCGGKLAHGNVSSSVIFLNSKQYGCVSAFGLAGLVKSPGNQVAIIYRVSKYVYKVMNASQENDVYNFGVVLLELLTSKSPTKPQGSKEDIDHLVKWAHTITPEDWSSKLFDQRVWSLWTLSDPQSIFCDELDMLIFKRGLDLERKIIAEMVEMLHVAWRCLVMLPQYRPKISEVVLLLENVVRLGNKNT